MNWEGGHALGLTGKGMTTVPLNYLPVFILVYCEFVALPLCSYTNVVAKISIF